MKIATYNLRKGGSRSRIHWRKIFEAIAPEIFQVQESYPYHCDGIFVPATWYPYLHSCDVLASED